MKRIKPYDIFFESNRNNTIYYDEYKYDLSYNDIENILMVKKTLTQNNPNIKTDQYYLPLSDIIQDNNINDVKLLLSSNVGINIDRTYVDYFNSYYILDANSIDMLELLLKYGANINSVNGDGDSLFTYFWDDEYDNKLSFLIDYNIDWELPAVEYSFIDHVFMKDNTIFDDTIQKKLNIKLKERYPEKYDFYRKRYKVKKFNI